MNDLTDRGLSGRPTIFNAIVDGALDQTARWLPPSPGHLEPELATAVAALSAANAVGDTLGSLLPEDRPEAEAIVCESACNFDPVAGRIGVQN